MALTSGDARVRVQQAVRARARNLRHLNRAAAEQNAWLRHPPRDERINAQLRDLLDEHGPGGGDVLEIGGRLHPRGRVFGDMFTYRNLDLAHTDETTLLGDITACPQIPDASFDVVLSVDVFEHIDRPWLAAAEIQRILRPGGLTFTSTLFAWRYHPCPIDYWRYTPDALAFLFDGVRTVANGFDATERRRDVRKKARQDPMPVDALGGWRENVRVFHAGIKSFSS